MIDISKNWATREGHKVVLLTDKCPMIVSDRNAPILGHFEGNSSLRSWYADGTSTGNRGLDLIPEKSTLYVNIFSTGLAAVFQDEEGAKNAARNNRVETCLKIEYTPGQRDF